MSDENEQKPVAFTEAFRIARRNSLAWSSIAILALLGTRMIDEEKELTVPLFGTGLSYEPDHVLIATFLAATFFVLGFFNAARSIKLLNSQKLRGLKVKEVDNALKILKAEATTCLDRLKTGAEISSKMNDEFERAFKGIDNLLVESAIERKLLSEDDLAAFWERRRNEVVVNRQSNKLSQPDRDHIRHVLDTANKRIEETLRQFRSEVNATKQTMVNANNKNLPKEISGISDQLKILGGATNELTSWHSSIATVDRYFHLVYEQLTVYGLYLFAAIAFCARLKGYW